MPSAPLVVTWPGGIGNPVGEQIPTSGGRRRRRNTRKNRRNTRRMGCGLMRKSRRMGCGTMRKNRRRGNARRA